MIVTPSRDDWWEKLEARGRIAQRVAVLLALLVAFFATTAHAERVKDLASVQGVRPNQLEGYGRVLAFLDTHLK